MNYNKSILGLHIDDDSLNIVYLRQESNGLKVQGRAVETLQQGVVKDGLIIDEETVAQKIRDFIKTAQPRPRKAIVSLPCSATRFRASEFSVQTNQQLQKQIEEQVNTYALFGGKEVVYDYCAFEQTTGASNEQPVLLAVTSREISDACLSVIAKSKLDLVRIEPAAMPIIKLIYNKLTTDSDTASVLLVLDSASGNVSVFKDGLPRLSQNLSFGIKEILQEKNALGSLQEQLKDVLQFAQTLTNTQQITLHIAAGCSTKNLKKISAHIKKTFSDVQIEQINQSRIAEQFDVQLNSAEDVPVFAFSSALTDFDVCEFDNQLNLVSEETLVEQKTQAEMSLTSKAIMAVVLISIAAILPLRMKIKSIEAASARIEARIAEAAPMRQKVIDLIKQMKQLKEKQAGYASISSTITDIPWQKVLQVIAVLVPDEVRIVNLSTTDSADLKMIGEALAEKDVNKFAKKLDGNKLFETVKVKEIEYDENSTENIINYEISCKIRMTENNL